MKTVEREAEVRRWSSALFWVALALLASIPPAFLLRVPLAFQDPDLALALEVLNEGNSALTKWRIQIFMMAGADANREITQWNTNEPPLVVSARLGSINQVSVLIDFSSEMTWRRAVAAACAADPSGAVVRTLAEARKVDSASLCFHAA